VRSRAVTCCGVTNALGPRPQTLARCRIRSGAWPPGIQDLGTLIGTRDPG
jgi:hypothetical protein